MKGNVHYIPEGYHTVTPYLLVRNAGGLIDFLQQVFDAKETERMQRPDGSIMHAEMNHKDSVFMLGPASRKFKTKTPKTFKGTPVSFYLYVDDVERAFEQAKKAGAKVVAKPVTQFWGDRTGTLNCPDGHKWTLAQNVADFDPSNVPG